MGGRRLRFRLTNVISRVLLINLRRAHRVKPQSIGSSSSSNKRAADDDIRNRNAAASVACQEEVKNLIPRGSKQLPSSSSSSKNRRGAVLGGYSCCRQAGQSVQENCQYRRPSGRKKKSRAPKTQEEMWESEGFWNVIAEVDDKLVRKKIVLRKRKSGGSRKALTPNSEASTTTTQQDTDELGVLEKKGCAAQASSTFRLSTSSGDASLGPENLAWDREHHSLFASDDSSSSRATTTTATIPEEDHFDFKKPARYNRRSLVSACSSAATPPKRSLKNSPQEEQSLLSSSTPYAYGRPRSSSRRLDVLESSSKVWGDCADRVPGLDLNSSAADQLAHKNSRSRSRRNSASLPAAVKGKVRESVPVSLVSSDPYQDFRQSMVRMISEKRLNNAADLEELLECYLYLNPPAFHQVIVQVFTDLWLQQGAEQQQ